MENFEVQNDYNSLELTLLYERISQLRLQKGSYLSNAFVKDIDSVHYALSLAINNSLKSVAKVVNPKPEKISDSMIDCCLCCMEEILQELIDAPQQQEKSAIFYEMEDLRQDLYILSIYIRYSIDHNMFKIKRNQLCEDVCDDMGFN